MGGRIYDPLLGLFLSPDPIINTTQLNDYNLYLYAHGNPIKYDDPTGLVERSVAQGDVESHPPSDEEQALEAEYLVDAVTGKVIKKVSDKGDEDGVDVIHYVEQKEDGSIVDKGTEVVAQGGGGVNYSNSSIALDIGGGIYGGLQGLTSSQGYWLGKNGKYYSNSWGGNQYTGSRAGALKAANQYKMAGRATVVGSALLGGYMTYEGYVADGGQFGYNAQMAAASSAGSIMGGLAGAEAGALIGAGIGAWFGGVGAIPGAVIGGVVGGFGFGMAGGYYGGQLGGSAVNYYHGR